MSSWKQIRLELDRTADFPLGSVARAYLLRLPITADHQIDLAAYREHPLRAVVRRHWSTEPDQSGHLIQSGEDWIIRCDGTPECCIQLNGRPLQLGQQVPLRLSEGTVLPLRVASLR